MPSPKAAKAVDSHVQTATITEVGPGGRACVKNGRKGWHGHMADGTAVTVIIAAKMRGTKRTMKIATLHVGQVVHVTRHPTDPTLCSVSLSDVSFISPSKASRAARKRQIT